MFNLSILFERSSGLDVFRFKITFPSLVLLRLKLGFFINLSIFSFLSNFSALSVLIVRSWLLISFDLISLGIISFAVFVSLSVFKLLPYFSYSWLLLKHIALSGLALIKLLIINTITIIIKVTFLLHCETPLFD